jgi:trehalose 6-phosphate phosphatase
MKEGGKMLSAATSEQELQDFFVALGKASQRALLLDYDGTLAPFRANRRAALPYLGVAELLTSIMTEPTKTRLSLVTGRTASELKSMIPLSPAPEIWGSHGLERLKSDGSYEIPEIPPDAVKLLTGIDQSLKAEGFEPIVELKPGATAVHWRNLSKRLAGEVRERTMQIWEKVPKQPYVYLAEFDGGLEFRLRLRNKGDAVRQVLSELPEDAPVAYLGDDRTDEDAFLALKNRGLSVLVRNELRPTAADIWIQPPEGVLAFLTNWLRACREGASECTR